MIHGQVEQYDHHSEETDSCPRGFGQPSEMGEKGLRLVLSEGPGVTRTDRTALARSLMLSARQQVSGSYDRDSVN